MNKKYSSYFYFIVAIIWLVTGILNIIISRNHSNNETSFGFLYIGLAMVCICLSMAFIAIGIRKLGKNS